MMVVVVSSQESREHAGLNGDDAVGLDKGQWPT